MKVHTQIANCCTFCFLDPHSGCNFIYPGVTIAGLIVFLIARIVM